MDLLGRPQFLAKCVRRQASTEQPIAETCHSDRSEPTPFLFAFASCERVGSRSGGISLRSIRRALFEFEFFGWLFSLLLYIIASLLRSCFKKILNSIAFTNIVTKLATSVAL